MPKIVMRSIAAPKQILLGSLLCMVSLSAMAELVPIAVVNFTASRAGRRYAGRSSSGDGPCAGSWS